MGQSTRLFSAGKSGASVGGTNPPGLVTANVQATNAASLPATQVVANTAETVLVDPANTAIPLILTIPPSSPLEQEEFEVIASGTLNHGASLTVNIKLYSGTSLTVGSDTLLGASGAISAFTGKAPWKLRAKAIYDSVSGKMNGTIQFVVNNNLVAEAAFSNVVTGISNSTFNGVVNFVLSVTFGTGNAANSITVKDFGVNH
jgi:hypothetical protein